MSITDELRIWAEGIIVADYMAERLTDIIDRIDAQHRSALEKVAAMVDEPSQDAFDVLMDGFNIGRARGYDEGFKAHLADLEARVERIERLLSHKGGAE